MGDFSYMEKYSWLREFVFSCAFYLKKVIDGSIAAIKSVLFIFPSH